MIRIDNMWFVPASKTERWRPDEAFPMYWNHAIMRLPELSLNAQWRQADPTVRIVTLAAGHDGWWRRRYALRTWIPPADCHLYFRFSVATKDELKKPYAFWNIAGVCYRLVAVDPARLDTVFDLPLPNGTGSGGGFCFGTNAGIASKGQTWDSELRYKHAVFASSRWNSDLMYDRKAADQLFRFRGKKQVPLSETMSSWHAYCQQRPMRSDWWHPCLVDIEEKGA